MSTPLALSQDLRRQDEEIARELDKMGDSLDRLAVIGQAMGQELRHQSDVLDEVHIQVDHNTTKLSVARKQTESAIAAESGCTAQRVVVILVLCVLLLIAVAIILFVTLRP